MSKINFGFKKVEIKEKQNLVNQVFSSVASKYDVMNDLMSAGLHRIWKDKMVNELSFNPNKEYKIIDVAGGTGDIAFKIINKAIKNKAKIQIDIVDINKEMLEVGKNRAIDKNYFKYLNFNKANGEKLPYEDNSFDYYTIAFGIRNFTNIEQGLKEAYRVLKPNGKFICLEFSKINNNVLSKIYDLYSFNVIPKIGKFIAKDSDSYTYLVESIRKFPTQESFKNMIMTAKFKNAEYKNLNNGIVSIHMGEKF